MSNQPSLERLEQDVLSRIQAHRKRASSRSALPIGAVVTASALIIGLGVGVASAQHRQSTGASEAVVLGEDALLAPSSLLASGP